MKESSERCVRLETHEPGVFQVYQHWLYCKTHPIRNEEHEEHLPMARAYMMGDILQDGDFRDGRWPCVSVRPAVRYLYDNTHGASKVRSLLVDLCVSNGLGWWLVEWEKETPSEALLVVAAAALDRRDPPREGALHGSVHILQYDHGRKMGICYRTRSKADEAGS